MLSAAKRVAYNNIFVVKDSDPPLKICIHIIPSQHFYLAGPPPSSTSASGRVHWGSSSQSTYWAFRLVIVFFYNQMFSHESAFRIIVFSFPIPVIASTVFAKLNSQQFWIRGRNNFSFSFDDSTLFFSCFKNMHLLHPVTPPPLLNPLVEEFQ